MAPNQHGHHHDHYDSQTYAGDRATQVQRTQAHMPDEDRSTKTELQAGIADSQSKQLASQVRIGDDRAIGDTPNWERMTSTQLHAAATQNNSPDTSDSLGRAFNDGGNRLTDAANRLMAAVGKLDAAWSGNAADSAKGALNPLADAAGQAGLAAQLMGAQMARQTAAASEVRKLPPPKEFDYSSELQTALANPNPVVGMQDMKAKKDEADAVKREQVAYLNSYTQSMSAVDSQMPSFVEPAGHISGGDGGRSHITGGGVDYVGPPGGGKLTHNPNQGTAPGVPGGAPGAGFPGSGPDGTDGQDVGPLPNFGGIGTGTSGYTPTAPTTGLNLPGGGPGAGAPHLNTPGAGQGGFGGGFGSFGGGGGASGGGGLAGPEQAGRAGGSSSGGPGRGPGAGGGAGGLGEHAGSAGRAGAGAGRGGAGMGGGGAGGGRKDEDDEHDRPSYLVEADPDATFGTDEVTAPPVIGQE